MPARCQFAGPGQPAEEGVARCDASRQAERQALQEQLVGIAVRHGAEAEQALCSCKTCRGSLRVIVALLARSLKVPLMGVPVSWMIVIGLSATVVAFSM